MTILEVAGLVLSGLSLAFCCFMIYRNDWVYTKKMKFIDLVYKKAVDGVLVDNQKFYYDCVWSYEKMVWSFWIWDLSKMVNNEGRYLEVVGSDVI